MWVVIDGELLSFKGNKETCLYELVYGEEIREAGWVTLLWPLNSLSSNKECIVKFGNGCKRRKNPVFIH